MATMTPEEIRITFDWLPDDLIDAYINYYTETEDETIIWAQIRQDSRYEEWFPGNMTDDGRPRYAEDIYAAVTASYDDVFKSVGITGVALDEMKSRYGELIRGDVSPQELETNRVVPMYERIISQSDALRSFYSSTFGVDMSLGGLVAAAMDPTLGEKILTEQISLAEIGGEFEESGFDLDFETVTQLYETGKIGRAEADKLAQESQSMLPRLNTLVQRHNDPDDTFDVEELIKANVFTDPEQQGRIRRLFAQENTLFESSSKLRREQSGGVTGLVAK